MTFTLSTTIPDELLDVEQANLVEDVLSSYCNNLRRWKGVYTSQKLRDSAGNVVGWVKVYDEEVRQPTWQERLAAEPSPDLACLRDDVNQKS